MLDLIPPLALIDRAPGLDGDGQLQTPIRLVDLDLVVPPSVVAEAAPQAEAVVETQSGRLES